MVAALCRKSLLPHVFRMRRVAGNSQRRYRGNYERRWLACVCAGRDWNGPPFGPVDI